MRIALVLLNSESREVRNMFNLKLLVAGSALAAGIWQIWTSPGPLSLILHVLTALIVAWGVFVAVLYLTAAHLRRTPAQSRVPRPMTPAARIGRNYTGGLTRNPR
jgi:hypothetical protein